MIDERSSRTAFLAILLAAFALRVFGLASQELRGDEAFGYFFSLQTPQDIVSQTLRLQEPHPVAAYWLQHLWLALAGDSEFSLRFTSAWWGTLAVVWIIVLGRRLALDGGVVWTGALLLTISPYAVWHAQDARMYSMSLALTLATTYLAATYWDRPRLWIAVAYMIVAALALQTHYFSVYVLAAQSVVMMGLALWNRGWSRLGLFLATQATAVILTIPWFWAARHILAGYTGNGDSPNLADALRGAFSAFLTGETAGPDLRTVYAVLFALALGAGVWRLSRPPNLHGTAAWWLIGLGLGPVFATWVSAQARPIFDERYLVAAVAPLYLLIAAGVVRWRRARFMSDLWLGLLVAAMVAGLVRYHGDPAFRKDRGWRELAAGLETLAAGRPPEQVRLVQNYPDPTLWYYYRGPVDHLVLPPRPLDTQGAVVEVGWLVDDGVGRAVLVIHPSPDWDPGGIAENALASAYRRIASTELGSWPVQVYSAPAGGLSAVNVTYSNGLRLKGAQVIPDVVDPGGIVEVQLAWDASTASLGGEEQVSVQLLDSAGRLVGQTDRPLGAFDDQLEKTAAYGILAPAEAANGDLTVAVVVYDANAPDLARLTTKDGTDITALAVLQVLPGR